MTMATQGLERLFSLREKGRFVSEKRRSAKVVFGAIVAALIFAALPAFVTGQPGDAKEKPPAKGVRGVAFSPDGKYLAAAVGEQKKRGLVVLWDVASRTQLWAHEEDDGVHAVCFSPDGKTLAIGGYDHKARLLVAATGRVTKVFEGHAKDIRAVAFAPDGKTLATGGLDKSVRLWDLATGKEKAVLEWPDERSYSLAYSPSGQWLMATGEATRVWDVAAGTEKRLVQSRSSPGAVFANDDWFLTAGGDGTIRLWNVETGKQPLHFGNLGGVERLAFSRTSRLLAETYYFGNYIQLLDFTLDPPAPTERERINALVELLDDDNYDIREKAGKDLLAVGFVAEPELRRIMKESASAEVRIRTRRLREQMLTTTRGSLVGHTERVDSIEFSPDGRLLASGSMDGTVRLWRTNDFQEAARLTPSRP